MLLTKGANAELKLHSVLLTVSWMHREGLDVDASALLLRSNGKVGSDSDFIFYNQPQSSNRSVEHRGKKRSGSTWLDSLSVDLDRVDQDVERIVIAGSADGKPFKLLGELLVTVNDPRQGTPLVEFSLADLSSETALVFLEVYRRQGSWKVRAVGQGYDTGLFGLATDFGIDVEAPPAEDPPPAHSDPDWYPAPDGSPRLRWWAGGEWTQEYRDIPPAGSLACPRCGRLPRKKLFQRTESSCAVCDQEISLFLTSWKRCAEQVLDTTGPAGSAWEDLWVGLRKERIDSSVGRSSLRAPSLRYLEKYVAFAFADGEIEESELAGFNEAVQSLRVAGDQAVRELRRRMERGRRLTQVRAGDLPRATNPSLMLDSDEILYVDEKVVYIRVMASGPRPVEGRLVATNKKLRFLAAGPGSWELAWGKVMSAESEYGRLVLATTAAKGGGEYEVADGDLLAAILVGVLRVSKRLVLAPGERDTRSIPQHMRTTVWQRDGGACVECRSTAYLEFDHVISRSKGGATSVNNLQLLCRKCNSDKGDRI